jgi:NADH-quinone oxidoreductase subunit E
MSGFHHNPSTDHLPAQHLNPQFPAATLDQVRVILARYPEEQSKSAVLPVLHLAQAHFGWLSSPVMDYVAGLIGILPIEVYEVATFYTMFHTAEVGKYVLEVCRTGPCCLLGAEEVIEHLCHKLGIEEGETSADGMFTIKPVECLAACGYAPVMQIREQYFEKLTPASIDQLLDNLRQTDPKTVGYEGGMPVSLD